MIVPVHKNRATSRRLGQRRDVPESNIFQCHDIETQRRNVLEDQTLRSNVVTF